MDESSPESQSLNTQRRIKIDIPEVFKQNNEEVWEELEKYIFTGFLSSQAVVANQNFVFKSLNHYELKNIDFMRPMRSAPAEARSLFRSHFIAHSIFMINGSNVLYDRPKNINRMIRLVLRLDPKIQDKIIENLSALNSRAHRLYPLTEFYVQENRSRYKWLQISNVPVHSVEATGIPGTDMLGMNYSQQTWVAMNRANDKREQMERDWANAKFIGSCMSKGVRNIDERDRARIERERTELEERKLKALYSYLNRTESGEGAPETVTLPDGRTAVVEKRHHADSVQELAAQLESALSGEKDHHDMIVEKTLRENNERNKAIEEQRAKLHSLPMIQVDAEEFAGGQSKILGGHKEADIYLERIRRLKSEQRERAFQEPPDLDPIIENSDKTIE